MGQELSQPPGSHAQTISPISSSGSTSSHTPSLIQVETNNTKSTKTMTGQSESDEGLDVNSSDTDLPIKKVDSANEDGPSGNAAGLDTSDDTQPLSDTFEQQVFYKRELRPLREPKRTAPNTWVDADTTGDFDPHEEARQARLRRKKAKLSHRKKIDWISEGHTHDGDNDINLTAQPRPPLRLSFNTSSGKAAFNELDAKFRREVKPARDHFTAGYQLRKRDITGEGNSLGTIGAKIAGVRLLGSEQPCNYSNHPVARGCVACLTLVRECSLMRNEHAWPCDECEDDDNDCQLVQEPELKLACTHCEYLRKKNKWLVCSFDCSQDPADHRGRCERCEQENHQSCIAGPRPGHTRTRIRIAPDGTPYSNEADVSQKTWQVKTCRQCLNSQRICSFASRSLRGAQEACTACDMSGESCEPLGLENPEIRVPQQPSTNLSADALSGLDPSEEIITLSSSPPQTPKSCRSEYSPDTSADPPDDAGGSLKTVRTRFCHPMHFDYQDKSPDGSDPCHFCSCVQFGILGLEKRTVDVIDRHDGRGWEETGGGHKGDDLNGTQVCSQCSLARMRIMVCDDHALRRTVELGMEGSLQEAFARLVDPDQADDDRWCTVCCNLAAWKCCVSQGVGSGEGCGLALCEQCVTDLGKCGGSLETMLQALVDEPSEARPAGLRADYELLKNDGLLRRYLDWAATN